MLTPMQQMMFGSDDDEPKRPKLAPDIEAIRLRDSLAAFIDYHELKPGMTVRQKPQARLYTGFGDNDIAIVVALLPEPIISNAIEKFGTAHFREPVDMIVGSIEHFDDKEVFTLYHVDSRRFEPVLL